MVDEDIQENICFNIEATQITLMSLKSQSTIGKSTISNQQEMNYENAIQCVGEIIEHRYEDNMIFRGFN